MPTAIDNQNTNTQTEIAEPNFGQGKYSAAMLRIYRLLVALFSVPTEHAERVARQFAIDYGAATKGVPVEVKLGKTNGDNQGTLSEMLKIKGITYSPAMNVARAIQWIGDAGKNGVSYGKTKWHFEPVLHNYVFDVTGE
jgi:hypothetical protein